MVAADRHETLPLFPRAQLIVAVTGHRPDKLGGYVWTPLSRYVVARLEHELRTLEPDEAITGMALGVDQWFGWLCVKLRIPFTAAVPFEGQELVWPRPEQRVNYHRLLGHAKKIVVVTRLSAEERRSDSAMVSKAMRDRNKWMVDRCDRLLAVWDGSAGGTGNCVREAHRVGRPITQINPRAAAA